MIVGVRIEGGPALAVVVFATLVLVPIAAGFARRAWPRIRGREPAGSFAATVVVALGLELGAFTGLVLFASEVATIAKLEVVAAGFALPGIAGLARARSRPGARSATFWRTFVAVLGIELTPIALGLLFVGANCLASPGYVEF